MADNVVEYREEVPTYISSVRFKRLRQQKKLLDMQIIVSDIKISFKQAS